MSMFRAVHIVEELGRGGGTRIGQALIVINVFFLLHRTRKPESVEEKIYLFTYGGVGGGPLKVFSQKVFFFKVS